MAVNLKPPERLHSVAGIRLASHAAGIRYSERKDLLLIELAQGSVTSAVFTRNVFCAAPVVIARRHLATAMPRYLLINAGNANAGTGPAGEQDAMQCCQQLAVEADCREVEILPFSTGVIGARLPAEKIINAYPQLIKHLDEDEWLSAASAIMTTDTVSKAHSRRLTINNTDITITGIAKGSGMICPDMATMLSFIATDLKMTAEQADALLKRNVEKTFNAISVDGDTSTNDACVLVATGKSDVSYSQLTPQETLAFEQALYELMKTLAQAVVRDGEGATKFITVRVEHASDEQAAKQVAYTVAHSPLIKTAFFASDPNWGRILAAVGRSRVTPLDINRVSLFLNDVCVVEYGIPHVSYTEESGQAVMSQAEIIIRIDMGSGDASSELWTCDLSHEYVRINAEYRS